jgi:5-(carboxyamino)imidazole ribonucleotide synthase
MKPFNPAQQTIAMLGGGQLGRMLLQSAIDLNLTVWVMDSDANAPCKNLAAKFTCGDLMDEKSVYDFGKKADIITIEIEHVNVNALKKLRDEGKKVYPQPEVIETIQDKGLQKMFYQRNEIPTPDFFIIENKQQIERYGDYFPFFQKLRKGGYDGKGVQKLAKSSAINNAFDAPSVLERMVDFEKEISVLVARNEAGEMRCFPVVECEFNPEANLVEFLFSPARIKKSSEQEAYNIAKLTAEKMGIVGLLAVELFLCKDGKILVNEVAPRPHNSGHHTIEANNVSQFEQHLRAITGLPLGNTDSILPGVMINLLGEKGHEGPAKYKGLDRVLEMKGAHVHLYGKANTKPFRKMGHVTVVDENLEIAKQKAKKIKDILKVVS